LNACNGNYKAISDLVSDAKRILVITGAGLSADSGLPTYRGIGGLYEAKETEDELPIEAVLSGRMLQQSPEVTWKYLLQIESACRGAQFNRGHEIIAAWQAHAEVWVLTQNIDGFHGDAGTRKLIEMHGNVHHLRCTRCGRQQYVDDYSQLDFPPSCDACGALIRPQVVLFGEMLPDDACEELSEQLSKGFDIVFTIGTSSLFPYIAQPVIDARRMGVPTVEINPLDTEVSQYVDYKLAEGAKSALEKIQAFL